MLWGISDKRWEYSGYDVPVNKLQEKKSIIRYVLISRFIVHVLSGAE